MTPKKAVFHWLMGLLEVFGVLSWVRYDAQVCSHAFWGYGILRIYYVKPLLFGAILKQRQVGAEKAFLGVLLLGTFQRFWVLSWVTYGYIGMFA